MVEEAL